MLSEKATTMDAAPAKTMTAFQKIKGAQKSMAPIRDAAPFVPPAHGKNVGSAAVNAAREANIRMKTLPVNPTRRNAEDEESDGDEEEEEDGSSASGGEDSDSGAESMDSERSYEEDEDEEDEEDEEEEEEDAEVAMLRRKLEQKVKEQKVCVFFRPFWVECSSI